MRDHIGAQSGGPRSVLVMHDQGFQAEIHQDKGDRTASPSGANQNGGFALGRGTAETALEIQTEAAAVGVISGGMADFADNDGINGANLARFGRQFIQQRNDFLLERKGHVHAGEAGRLHGVQQAIQRAARQSIDIH